MNPQFIGLDVETTGDGDAFGLQPYRVLTGEARITALSVVGAKEIETSYFSKLEPARKEIKALLIKLATKCKFEGYRVIGWNTPFDVAWLCAYGFEEECRRITWADGEIYLRCLINDSEPPTRGKYGLKGAVAKYLPQYEGYEKEVAGDFDKIDASLLLYNRNDAAYTAQLGGLLYDRLTLSERTLCNVICSAIVPFAAAWVNGLEVDKGSVSAWSNRAQAELEQHRLQLETQALTPTILNSPAQLKQNLIERGYNIDSVDRTTLTRYKGDVLIDAISAYKKANTALTKFIGGIDKSLEYNGGNTTHPAPRLWNTYTGRVGYTSKTLQKYQTGIAIHQWVRGVEARDFLVAPQGYLLAEYDFATQEGRILADASDDPVLLNIFRNRLDFHTYMAARIADTDYDSLLSAVKSKDKDAVNYRYLGKMTNCALTFRLGWKGLIDKARTDYDVLLSEKQAQDLHRLYRETYVGVPDYWNDAIYRAKHVGYALTRGNRKVWLDNWSRDRAWSTEGAALSFPIQGTAADQKYLAVGVIDPMLHRLGGRYMLDLHDALFLLIPDNSQAVDHARDMQRVLSNLPYERVYGWKPKVPMPVDLKIGKSWGSLKEVND